MPAKKTDPILPSDVIEAYLLHSKDGIAIFHPDGTLGYCNPANHKIFGYRSEELCGLRLTEMPFLNKDQTEKVSALFSMLKGRKEPDPLEIEATRKDGEKIWVEINASLLKRKDKSFAIQAVFRDISKKKSQDHYNELYRRFDQLVSRISSRILIMPEEQVHRGIGNALAAVAAHIGAKWAGLFLVSEDRKRLCLSHEWFSDPSHKRPGDNADTPAKEYCFPASVLDRSQDYVICRPSDLPGYAGIEREFYKTGEFFPLYILPIISEDTIAATLNFAGEYGQEYDWPKQFSHLLQYISTVLLSANRRKDIYRKLRLARFSLERYTDGVFWITPEYRLFEVNRGACDALGYTREELLSMHVYDFDSNYDQERLNRQWKRLKSKRSERFESVHKKKNGDIFPVEITANLLDFEGKEILVAFAHDISNRKQAENTIRKSEQEFRKIFDNVLDVFFEASLDGKLINVTPSVEHFTKYRRDEIIGQPMTIFYHKPEVREPLLKELHEKGYVSDFEFDFKDKDGSPIPASLSSRLIYGKDGNPRSIVGSVVDISHRKKAEIKIRQLSTALEQSPVPVIITDTDLRILYVNNSFTELSGMKPEEVIGATPDIITRGQIWISENRKLLKTIRAGRTFRDESEYTLRTGERLWLSYNISPVIDEASRVTHYVVILEDITGRKTYEEELKKAKETAEESDRLKSAFLANMSHEIRTPMNAILGFSSLLKDPAISREKQAYYIDIIDTKGKDLLKIISDIIDVSRIEAGDLSVRTEPVMIYEFIRKIYNEYEQDVQFTSRSNLQFRLSLPDRGKAVIVNTDPSRLKQVFVNLIQNAIKFTPEGYIEMGFELQKDHTVRFYVKDSGIGIPREKQKIIFDRFRQIDDSHTRQSGGTGLGLTISLSLVQKMGGELSVISGENKGSEFSFALKYILPGEQDGKEAKHEKDSKQAEPDMKGKKVLIVEDDEASYLLLETLLKQYHTAVTRARNGVQALANLSESNYDLIMMDIRMPEMNGMETTSRIREKYPDLPVIAQTAYARETDREEAMNCGCNDYISKPINTAELKSILLKYFQPSSRDSAGQSPTISF